MYKSAFALSIVLALSSLTGCSVAFSYKVVDPPPGPRYLTTHCVSSNNCKVTTTNDDGTLNK